MTAIAEHYVISHILSSKSLHSFRVVDGGYIKALLRRGPSCRHQHIIQEVDSEIPFQYLEAGIHQWQVSRFQ